MSSESIDSRRSSYRSVPMAIWLALALLVAATAGLGGALFMHSRDAASVSTRTAATSPAPASETSVAGAGPTQPTGVAGSFLTSPGPQSQPAQAPPQLQPQGQVPPQPLVRSAQLAPTVPIAPAPVQAAPRPTPPPVQVAQAPREMPRPPVCATCGTVEAVHAVRVKGNGTGIGVAGGALTGGLLGHQVGGGSGKTALTVLGAVGGAFAGNEVEKRVRATTAYDVQVRMDDGRVRSIRRGAPIAVGTQVRLEGNTLRIAQRPGGTRPPDIAQHG
jgi:outer membrane lipoprotein SlyB